MSPVTPAGKAPFLLVPHFLYPVIRKMGSILKIGHFVMDIGHAMLYRSCTDIIEKTVRITRI